MKGDCGTRMFSIALAAASAVLVVSVATAMASFSGPANAAPTVSTLTLGTSGSVTATTSNACVSVSVSWTAVANADSYRIQVKETSGVWIDLTQTGNVTSATDAGGHTATGVTYRVFARDSGSGWEASSATQSTQLAC